MQTVVMKKEETGVVLAPDFRLALSVLAVGLQLWWTLNWSTLGIFISVVGGFLTMQTARLRFRFTSSAIDVLRVRGLSDTGSESEKAGKLATDAGDADVTTKETARAVGPWKFSSIANWDFWWPGFPVLAYFKETQVKEDGQRHFLPVIMDGKALYQQMLLNFGPSRTAKPPLEEWQNLQPLHPRGYARYKQMLLTWGIGLEGKLQLGPKLQMARSLFQGLQDPARREETKKELKILWDGVLVWLREVVTSAKQFVERKTAGK